MKACVSNKCVVYFGGDAQPWIQTLDLWIIFRVKQVVLQGFKTFASNI